MNKAIILDRDGVINQDSNDFIKSPGEWVPIPESLEAIARLCQAGYRVIVVTNQSGIARDLFSSATLEMIHKKMCDEVVKHGGEIAAIYFCPHGPDDDCECRKPKAGLFEQAQRDFDLDFNHCISVGDSLRDIQAAEAVGCEAVLVRTGKGERMLANHATELQSVQIFNDLLGFVNYLLAEVA